LITSASPADPRTTIKVGILYQHVSHILRAYDRPGALAIEIGCGANRYGDVVRARHIGVDLPAQPYAGVPDVYGDGRRLPFVASCADLVFMVGVLYNIPEADAVLAECRRVLRQGGTLLVFDYNRTTTLRLKRARRAAQVWSPRALRLRVAASGFRAASIWDYPFESEGIWKRALLRVRAIRYLRHATPFNEGWNIVAGTKIGS
jgi:SAM-dependent methyltransferase